MLRGETADVTRSSWKLLYIFTWYINLLPLNVVGSHKRKLFPYYILCFGVFFLWRIYPKKFYLLIFFLGWNIIISLAAFDLLQLFICLSVILFLCYSFYIHILLNNSQPLNLWITLPETLPLPKLHCLVSPPCFW